MKTTTAGLSILAGGLAFAGSVAATDLIVNGSFEQPPGVGWVGNFGTYSYAPAYAYYAGPPIPASENPGDLYSWKHGRAPGDYSGPLTQTVALSPAFSNADIDAGHVTFVFSAWLASYTNDPERPYVTVQFLDGGGGAVGDLVVLDRTVGVNFVTFADGTTTFDRAAHEHFWAKYVKPGPVPSGARQALVGVTRNPTAGLGGNPDTYTDLVKLDVSLAPFVSISATPIGSSARADAIVTVVLQDGSTQVDPGSIQMTFDGAVVVPAVQRNGGVTTITYDPPGLLPSESSHSALVIAADNAAQITRVTNDFSFTVLSYYNLLLPAPLFLETFDSTAEGALPPGWSGVSFSPVTDPAVDFTDLNSAPYAGWTVVDRARFTSTMLSYLGHIPTDDYQRVLSANFANVINGVVVESLAQNKICFGDSGYRDGGSQVLYLFSPDFDCTGKTNVYLVFNSLWEQNQDSIGSVEYSVDQGATWLPLAYLIDRNDILFDSDGNIDPVATLGTVHADVATYTDPGDQQPRGGYYGAFIGVDSNRWSELGPYISGRVDDDPVESKRVEAFRLAAADNKSKVRLRFGHAGTDSWYFGIDNVGLYSLTALTPPLVRGPAPATFTEAVGNSVVFSSTTLGVGPFTYSWRRDGVVLSGQTNATLGLVNLRASDAGNYEVSVGYVGGAITAGPAVLTVVVPPPSTVLGQWDFNSQNLAATCGRDLEFFDEATDLGTGFTDSDFFGIPGLGGQNVNLMAFPGQIGAAFSAGYKMRHGLSGTDGGTNVNQYTLIMDIFYPAASSNARRTLLQTDPNNLTDGSFRIDENNGLGVSGVYSGRIDPDTWYRIALAVDLTGPGPSPIVAKFINGKKVGQQVLTEGRDGRWSLSANPAAPYALILGDNDVDVQPGYVSSIQLRSGRLSDAALTAMGGPGPGKIPGAVCARIETGRPAIRWSGDVLEGADDLTGPWTPVNNATKPYHVPAPLAAKKFYRSR